jgi:hypothetical protein
LTVELSDVVDSTAGAAIILPAFPSMGERGPGWGGGQQEVTEPTSDWDGTTDPELSIIDARIVPVDGTAPTECPGIIWRDDVQPAANYSAVGQALAAAGELYRNGLYGDGLLLIPQERAAPVKHLTRGGQLAPLIAEHVAVWTLTSRGNRKRRSIPVGELNVMIQVDAFRRQFQPVDRVTPIPLFLPNWQLTQPGFNDGGDGNRIYYRGAEAKVVHSLDTINAFLDAMDFASSADRTNTVAAALTVLLRNFWFGGKPTIVATATRSHAGKDTILDFACGLMPIITVTYDATDWALEKNVCARIAKYPDTGVIILDNARLDRKAKMIASAFIERSVTSSELILESTGSGNCAKRVNDVVFAISTNEGTLSADLMNRALPIHLIPTGNIEDRSSAIGNPKYEFLPDHREQIQAEVYGIVQRWIEKGRPLAKGVKHPFSIWAEHVGGMLEVSGYHDFLGNYTLRKATDDPACKAIGILGAARPGAWLRPAQWAELAVELSLVEPLIKTADRGRDAGRARGLGEVLTRHEGMTFIGDNDHERLTVRLERQRRRFERGAEAEIRYRFEIIARVSLQ